VVGDVHGRVCVDDDMIAPGVTMATAIRLLHTAGASGVIAGATDRLSASGIRDAVLTDTLPIPDSKRFPATGGDPWPTRRASCLLLLR
jgi:ribose-phosphate pyrophosphokinase